jgi:hypothetical protein
MAREFEASVLDLRFQGQRVAVDRVVEQDGVITDRDRVGIHRLPDAEVNLIPVGIERLELPVRAEDVGVLNGDGVRAGICGIQLLG